MEQNEGHCIAFLAGLEFVQLGSFRFRELILLGIIYQKTLEVNYNDDFDISDC